MDNEQTLRYSRQIILKDIGMKGQQKLLESKVLVIGAGGLGSPVLYYLAAAGIGKLGIVDFDVVGISNLQRQILHFTDDIGKKKVESAKNKLQKLNPDVMISLHHNRINIDNIKDLITDYDVIIDATDNFASRYLISDCCYFEKKPLIEGAVLGFEGFLMTILPDKSPCYRCLYPEPPEDGVVPNCNNTGILGAVTGVIGSMQAMEAMKVVLGIGSTLSGKILTFDGLESSFRQIPWKKKATCPLCGDNPTIKELFEYQIKCNTKPYTFPLQQKEY